ncbi:MAG: type I secretion system permease/ATPase [Pseudomonadota bacterium]
MNDQAEQGWGFPMNSMKIARQQFRRTLFVLAGFSLVTNLLLLTMPLYMLQIYDRVLPSSSIDTLIFLSVIAGLCLFTLGALEAVRGVIASRAAIRLETQLGADAMRASVSNSSQSTSDTRPVQDLTAVRTFLASRSVFALLDLPFAPLFIGILFFIHPTLFYLTVLGAVILLGLAIFNQRVTASSSTDAGKHQQAANSAAQSMARNGETLRAMGMTGNGISKWGAYSAGALTAQNNVDVRNSVLSGVSKSLRMGLQIAILGVGAYLVLQGEMTAGMIFAASIISGRGLQPIDQVIGSWKQFNSARFSWNSLISRLEQLGDQTTRTAMPDPKGNIDVDQALVLSPGGMSRPPILNRTSFSINAGDVVGVVGPSGSGKSTLARLLVGAQKADAGHVRIDGTEVENWDQLQLGQHIGYLGQEVELLPGTIADNIARLSLQPDEKAVLEAAQKAHVHSLIQNLPDGYDTLVGPGGTGLSGGQKQRIALARAFYGNPQIMVLDEPNANLDDDGEAALQKALNAARESEATVVVITQRKQILNSVDKIMRLHRGAIDFYGTRQAFIEALKSVREQVGKRLASKNSANNQSAPGGQSVPRAQEEAAGKVAKG